MDRLFQKLDSMNLSAEQLATMGSLDYDSLSSSRSQCPHRRRY
jgi:hypothetical protein